MHTANTSNPGATPNPASQAAPRLRPEIPIIWRSPNTVHFGDHTDPTTLSPDEASWIRSLNAYRTWQEARDTCPSGPDRAERVLQYARAAGAIDEPGECWWMSPAQRSAARAELLALARWHREPNGALAARSGCTIAVRGDPALAEITRQLLSECSLRTTDSDYADVFILAGTGHINAPEGHEQYAHAVHLPLRVHMERAAIGPIVIPGRTPCCGCLALHLRDRDSSWPAMAAQWRAHHLESGFRSPADPLVTRRAAIEAATLLRNWIDSPSDLRRDSSSARARLQTSRRVHLHACGSAPRYEDIGPHAACGCRWQSVDGAGLHAG